MSGLLRLAHMLYCPYDIPSTVRKGVYASMKKTIPIGVEFFDTLISKNLYYVDKTLFIKELLDRWSAVTLITRPRRFGKTLNMSMLECFFDVTADNRSLFEGLRIMEHTDIVEQYMNKHPVVFITLKDVEAPTYDDSIFMLKDVMASTYFWHQYLLTSDKLNDGQKNDFNRVLLKNVTEADLTVSLKRLMECLYIHHGNKKAFLLIDEYDAPINYAELKGFYPQMIEFMRGFFGKSMKSNKYLEFAVITGVQRIAKEGLFSELNNLTVRGIIDDKFEECFGFTKDEVEAACEYYDVKDSLDDIEKTYDGYRFGQKSLYNPWSIVNYLDSGRLEAYWVNTGSLSILENIFSKGSFALKSDMEDLLLDIPVTMKLDQHITYPIDYDNTNLFWTLLYNAGYLKHQKDTPAGTSKAFKAELVNLEVKESFRLCIERWMQRQPHGFSAALNEFLSALLGGFPERIQAALNDKLLQSLSYHDMIRENSFHMFTLGMLQMVGDEYVIRSNRESGGGRADCVMRPIDSRGKPDANRAAVVIEFKHAKPQKGRKITKAAIDGQAAEALRQIDEKGYARELAAEGYGTVYQYGIAFGGKFCVVKSPAG